MSDTRSRATRWALLASEVRRLHKLRRSARSTGKQLSVEKFRARRAEEWPQQNEGASYPFSVTSLRTQLQHLRAHVESRQPLIEWKVKPQGRQRTLTEAQELLAVRRINHLVRTTSGVTLNMARAEVEVVAAMRLPGEKDGKAAVARVKRCGGKNHLRSLLKRYGISVPRVDVQRRRSGPWRSSQSCG
jgi:hypothetical protein